MARPPPPAAARHTPTTAPYLAAMPPTLPNTLPHLAAPSSWYERTRGLTLTGWPTVTGTPGEVAFAPQLLEHVRAWPSFQTFPAHAWSSPALALDAQNVYLLVRGCSPQTVLLSGHYDTVATDWYGDLCSLAQSLEGLTEALIASLDGAPRTAPEALALQDLRSGAFLAGRGCST